jgi:hypothetical protein
VLEQDEDRKIASISREKSHRTWRILGSGNVPGQVLQGTSKEQTGGDCVHRSNLKKIKYKNQTLYNIYYIIYNVRKKVNKKFFQLISTYETVSRLGERD